MALAAVLKCIDVVRARYPSLQSAMIKDTIITGTPCAGSTFACDLLNRLPDVVARNEIMDLSGLLAVQDSASRVRIIADYLAAARLTIAKTGKVPQLQVAGPGDNTFLCATDEGRKSAKVGSTLADVGKILPQGFTLALKHLNCFAALLHHLRQHFNCLALVRNPLASWHTLGHPMRQGHMPVAETPDGALGRDRRCPSTPAGLAGLVLRPLHGTAACLPRVIWGAQCAES